MTDRSSHEIERYADSLKRGQISRRTFVVRATAAGLSFSGISAVLAACGGESNGGQGAQDGGGSPTTRELGPAERLTAAVAATPATLDREIGFGNEAAATIPNLYETGLVYETIPSELDEETQTPNFEVLRPNIYTEWKLSGDGRKLTITLKEGVMSSYGNELTSADVKYAHDRAASSAGAIGAFILGLLTVKTKNTGKENGEAVGVTAVDKYTVSIELDKPSIFVVPTQALGFGVGPVDSTEFKKNASADDPWATKWAGTNGQGYGPYGVEKFEAGRQAVYLANERYHGGKPRITRFVQQVVPEDSARSTSITAGAVDIAEFLSFRQLKQLGSSEAASVRQVEGNLSVHPIMNTQVEPFTDPRVRQALNYAVPRDQIREAVFLGFGRDAVAPVPANYPGFVEQGLWPHDLDRAKALLAEAGKSSLTTTLTYNAGKPHQEQIGQILLTEFAKVGVTLKLKKLPPAAFNDAYTARKEQMVFQEEQAILADATYQLHLYYYSTNATNFANYKNPRVDELLEKAIYTGDDAERQQLNAEAQEIIWDDAPLLWGWYEGWQLVTSKRVSGVSWGSQNNYEWFKLGVTE